MDFPNLKDLNKIVNLCRKQGIKTFELGELRITLTDEAPMKRARYTNNVRSKNSIQANSIPDSLPSEEELLFAAVGGPPDANDYPQ